VETRIAADPAVRLHRHVDRRILHLEDEGPTPEAVVSATGEVRFTAEDVQVGQELFRKRNLMNYGSVLGHGAYFGPDYTAEAIHSITDAMRAECSGGWYATLGIGAKASVDAEVAAEMKVNRYDVPTRKLTFTQGQTKGWRSVVDRYDQVFTEGQPDRALAKGSLLPPGEGGNDRSLSREAARQLAAFATWTVCFHSVRTTPVPVIAR
jgi:nitric oxide reductase subunit B